MAQWLEVLCTTIGFDPSIKWVCRSLFLAAEIRYKYCFPSSDFLAFFRILVTSCHWWRVNDPSSDPRLAKINSKVICCCCIAKMTECVSGIYSDSKRAIYQISVFSSQTNLVPICWRLMGAGRIWVWTNDRSLIHRISPLTTTLHVSDAFHIHHIFMSVYFV